MSEALNQLKQHLDEYHFKQFATGLPADYFMDFSIEQIKYDIKIIANLSSEQIYAIDINSGKDEDMWQIKLFKLNDTVSLSRGLPIIENFGFKLIDEHPYTINLASGGQIFVCDFGVEVPRSLVSKISDETLCGHLKEAIVDAFNRKIESDKLNKLVLYSGLTSRQTSLIRALCKYLCQTGLPFSYLYISDCLRKYSGISYNLFSLFESKFCPQSNSSVKTQSLLIEIVEQLKKVDNIDEDQILKAALSVIKAMLRTNYYQTEHDGSHKAYISFKLESAKVLNLPKPYPLYEIFVYSLRFEAVHLRGGKVARGGLRWSDRREDFRTEVLGLVKAQMVKNAVIVPTGSKGGFVCKKLPSASNREGYLAEGVSCYKKFISGLLDITDNLINGKIVKPQNTVCLDGDDPYLVVAADKGTATFSDYANEMSLKYGFWLGDAFASGGSAGYDHKKMGITAKGAWESVKRHFRHLGVNTQTDDFTVIGIGDLMGDVFGNGMLLSPHIKLLAAFNHLHIFLDPNPDPAFSFAERTRLFNLPRSSWEDYDLAKISEGGGIYSRSSKSIPLSAQVKTWLAVNEDEMSPNELIKHILKAKADLLYNGGIGTYIKASNQSNEEVKDKANDILRVNGKDLQVKVIGEGGNLGVTQLGRIEFAKNGGHIYTDAIDNSGGVDCSDHEVNIKILFADIMQTKGMSIHERNTILESMTENVSELVLRDNYLQTEILRTAEFRARYTFPNHAIFMRKLEATGELDRAIEFLPTDSEIVERMQNNKGLTLPEMAVILAYSKMYLDHELLKTSIVTDNNFNELLIDYFPDLLQTNYPEFIVRHYLRKEIIANQLANLVVNRAGITFISRFIDEFGISLEKIIRAWWTAYNLLDAGRLYSEIEALDNKINADGQIKLYIGIEKAVERLCRWILRYVKDVENVKELITKFKPQVALLELNIDKLIATEDYPDVKDLEDEALAGGVPVDLAKLVTRFNYLPQLMDITLLAVETGINSETIAKNYFALGRLLQIDWLRKNVLLLSRDNKWQALARSALMADVYALYRKVMKLALRNNNGDTKQWMDTNLDKIQRIKLMMDELQSYNILDLAMLSAAIREFANTLSN